MKKDNTLGGNMKKRFIAVAAGAALLVGGAAAAIPAGSAHAQLSTRCERILSQEEGLFTQIEFLSGQSHLTRTQQLFLQAAEAQFSQLQVTANAAGCPPFIP